MLQNIFMYAKIQFIFTSIWHPFSGIFAIFSKCELVVQSARLKIAETVCCILCWSRLPIGHKTSSLDRFLVRVVRAHYCNSGSLCLSVSLSVTLVTRRFRISKQILHQAIERFTSFSRPNFVVMSGVYYPERMCQIQNLPSLSKAQIWPIICNNLETVRDMM